MAEPRSHPVLSSLAAFLSAGLRPKTPLAKAVVFVLCLKLAVIVGMRLYLFSDETRPSVDEAAVARLLGVAPR
jgi:hypothetical protein